MPNNSITPAEKTQTMNLGGTMAFVQAVIQRFRSEVISPLIPSQASAQNQLADKAFVNSSIATATATYRGNYNLVSDLELTVSATEQQIATALATAISTADNNDYCYVQIPAADATPTVIVQIDRYKHNGTAWSLEYTLNNSGFTAAEWAAIQSGITAAHVTKLNGIEAGAQAHIAPTTAEVNAALGTGSGTTKFYREDGTWQEVDAAPEVQIGGVAPGSGSDIKLFVDENSDDTIEVYTKAQATGQFMVVVNSVSVPTASTLTYTSTDGTTKSFKVGDEIRVPDAEADNGYTFYKLYALTTEEGVTTATWDKLGAGGSSEVPFETVNISLAQTNGNAEDLIGATVIVKNEDTDSTILSTTWQGTQITAEVQVSTKYKVSVGNVVGYIDCKDQEYVAGYFSTRNISFNYFAEGVYIYDTDDNLTRSQDWNTANNSKVVGIAVMANESKFIISPVNQGNINVYNSASPCPGATVVRDFNVAKQDFNGKYDTNIMLGVYGSSTSYAAGAAAAYTFKNGKSGYLPAFGQLWLIVLNLTAINACITACSAEEMPSNYTWSSTYYGSENTSYSFWISYMSGTTNTGYVGQAWAVRAVCDFD